MKKKIVIFGAAGYGKNVLYSLDDTKYEVIAFIDNNLDIQGENMWGIYVDTPNNIYKYSYDFIVISISEYKEAMQKQLISLGVKEESIVTFLPNTADIVWRDTRISMARSCIEEIYNRNVSGNVAELGVYRGEFAQYLNRYLPDRKLYLFDTFEGFSENDKHINDIKLENNASFTDTSISVVMNKMTHPENCVIRKGYFPDTARDIDDTFCFVSLDADLYKPILSGLEYFYPRLQQGGYIFVHDYGTYGWSGTKKAVLEFCNKNKISYVPILDRCLSIIITK